MPCRQQRTKPGAETAYLFRNALLRAAAYELQPPADRALLHRMTLSLIPQVMDPQRLPAAALARRAMPWLPRDTPLARVPGVARLLKTSDVK